MIDHPTTDLTYAPSPASRADRATAGPPVPDAVCARPGADPELWFPEDWQDPAPAVAACASCPLLASCRSWALAHPIDAEYGVWGGLTAAERTACRLATRKTDGPAVGRDDEEGAAA